MSTEAAYEALSEVQAKLNAPKGQLNKFGGFNYRSCEDILQAVKPLLGKAVVLVSDEIKLIGDRFYVEATAKYVLGETVIENKAYAREPLIKKGMDESQITGATSSYARKYALSGLLLIDDNKDADTQSPEENCSVEAQQRPHPNSKEAQAAKQAAKEAHPIASKLAVMIANEASSEALESWAELNEDEKTEIWQLMNMKEKAFIRALKQEQAA